MARPVVRLTDKKIKSITSTGKEQTLSDGGGLQLRVLPSGTKSWQFKFKNPVSGKFNRMPLGLYPALSLANARIRALECQEQLVQGINPKAQEQDKKQAEKQKAENTLIVAAQHWFEIKKTKVTSAHAQRVWRTLEIYIFPKMGDLPLEAINRRNTYDLIRPIEIDGKLSTVKRICESLGQIMDHYVNIDVLDVNRLAKIGNMFAKKKEQHMATIKPEELPDFLIALNSSKTIQNQTKLLILWQLHTIARSKEAARTRWADINIEEAVWVIPAKEMKRRTTHRVPLTPTTLAILEQMKPLSGGYKYVFPNKRNIQSHANPQTVNNAIKKSLGYKDKLMAHGMRSIASTALHEHGYDSLVIEACLAHNDENKTRAAYMRSDFLEQRRPIMNWWSEFIENSSPIEKQELT
ncbi:tyrosine-type recombinase/integrase [uncultured Pseudoalteromonas sp.]|uniref:tyrosine-type recombinase/integrase n=1 Tax=uncultured Pseudoalteromonas sp. TaxID=114053 RepID=UPI0030D75923|tara:strand:- start:16269 stop:17492 length:1224 start_codon:yes stop_codon:yes gene_type:complete